MHIFTQRQKRTSQGPSEPPRSVFLSSRHRLRLEALARLSSSYHGKLWKPSAQEAPQSGCLVLAMPAFLWPGRWGAGGLPASLPQPGAWSLNRPYLSPSRHRCLCLVLGTKPLGRNPTSCRMASVDDQVLEGSLEGSGPRDPAGSLAEARDGWSTLSGFQAFLGAETLPQPRGEALPAGESQLRPWEFDLLRRVRLNWCRRQPPPTPPYLRARSRHCVWRGGHTQHRDTYRPCHSSPWPATTPRVAAKVLIS